MESLPHATDRLGQCDGDAARYGLSVADVLTYLRGARLVASARQQRPDRVNPAAAAAPIATVWFTDGRYVWDAAVLAYVKRYRMAVPDRFLQHVAAHPAGPPPVSDADVDAARALLAARR